MSIQEKFNLLGNFEITLIQWLDEFGTWRLGLDWKSESDYFFICEYKTIEQCLDSAIELLSKECPEKLKYENKRN